MTKVTRNLDVNLTNNSKTKNSSQKWLKRQANDIYTHQSKQEGYRSRAAYKLIEIQEKFQIIYNNIDIIDIGSSPGSWSQVLTEYTNKKIHAIDIIKMEPLQGVNFIQIDCRKTEEILQLITKKVELIVSDVAPASCGDKYTDHIVSIGICEYILDSAESLLKENGNLVIKMFDGRDISQIVSRLKSMFNKVHRFKPKSSRKESAEFYLVAKSYTPKS